MKGVKVHTITTTIRPDEQITVADDEYLDLKRQGLIAKDDAPEEKPAAQKEGKRA